MDPVSAVATITALGLVIKAIVDAIRRQAPAVDGFYVQAIAVVLGVGFAAGLDLRLAESVLAELGIAAGRTPHFLFDYIITGAAAAAGGGFLAEISHNQTDR